MAWMMIVMVLIIMRMMMMMMMMMMKMKADDHGTTKDDEIGCGMLWWFACSWK